ncbi:Rab-like protein 2A [Terramyces sp. JEL0728]|nr:Rab-like protein 2A [Terramyces sp. JEL0728]
MADVISVPEFAFYEFFNKTIQVPYKRIFVVFYGSVDPKTGESWCGDTRKALPLIRKTLGKVKNSVLLLVAAGDRETFKNMPNHPYKTDPIIKLTNVPTLIEYDRKGPVSGKRLGDKESGNQESLDKFILPSKPRWYSTLKKRLLANIALVRTLILNVFGVHRKHRYKNLDTWYDELVSHRGIKMPVIVVANKIDVDPSRATKAFAFVEKRRIERGQDLPFYFVSASDGSNVVTIFKEAIAKATAYREDLASGKAGTFVDEVLQFIKEEEKRPDGLFKPSIAPVS